MKETIEVYTDGSSTVYRDNGVRYGGIGVFFGNKNKNNYSCGFKDKDVSNQRMELTACIKAIEIIEQQYDSFNLTIITDSMYCINCVTKWCINWIKYNWKRKVGQTLKTIKNLDLIKKLYDLVQKYNVSFVHINSHQDEPSNKKSIEWKRWYGNDCADKLAASAKDEIKRLT